MTNDSHPPAGATPAVSIVMPVLNEAAAINDTLRHIHAIDGDGRCEVVVVDGDDGGSTIRAIDGRGVVALVSSEGRGAQMNAGARKARGDVLLFLHADTRLPATAIDDVLRACAAEGCDGGAFAHRFDSNRSVYRVMSRAITACTRRTRLPFGDQAIFLRRDGFESIGGFAPIPIMEDVEFVRRIRRRGGVLRVLGSEVRTSPRRFEERGPLRQTLRNAVLFALYRLGAPPHRLAAYYRPHGAARAYVLAAARDNP